MKRPVQIPNELCGIEYLSPTERDGIFQWYKSEEKGMFDEKTKSKLDAYANQRSRIYKECSEQYGLHTVKAGEAFKARCKKELPEEYDGLIKMRDTAYRKLNAEFNRRVLAITWDRVVTKDVLGKPLLSPEEWKKEYDRANGLQKHRMEMPYIGTVRPVGRNPFTTDKLIAHHIQEMHDWGFATSESCSGMLADHPDKRHYKDSPDNGATYKEGQPVHQSLYGAYAYVSFPKPESNWQPSLKNTQQQIDTIRRVAEENGWVALDMDSLLQPALRLELPMTYDGSSLDDIIQEAERLGEKTIPGFNALNYPDKVAAMFPLNNQVARQHGGMVPWNDVIIADRWNALSRGLKQAVELQRMNEADLNRISEARLITKTDGSQAVRCKIDGIQQSMKDVGMNIGKMMKEKGLSNREVCALVYKDELASNQSVEQQQNKGMKR